MDIKKIKKSKKFYNLEYIEKLFKIIPVVFISILTTVSILITYFIIESKEKRDIDLLKQNKELHLQFEKKEKLQSFVSNVSKSVEEELAVFKTKIQKNTYRIIGNLDQISLKDTYALNINHFLKKYEQDLNVQITVFEKENLNILYGKNNIDYLEDLIFGIKNDNYKKIVLQYISSQGKNNLQLWKNDLKGTLHFSFFDTIIIEKKEYVIGVFSNIKNIKSITRKIILEQINSLNNTNYQIWFLDLISKKSFNYYGNKEFHHTQDITIDQSKKYSILKYYSQNEEENKNFHKLVSYNHIFNYLVAINYNLKYDLNKKPIEKKYNNLFLTSVIYILTVSGLITLFAFLFSNFIKNILDRYNKKLQKRTDSLTHWKNRFELAVIASNDGLWDIDFTNNNIYFSQKWLEISGYKEGEISCFEDWVKLIHNNDKPNVELLFERIFTNQSEIFIYEYRLKTKSDGYKWILARGRVFIDEKTKEKRMLMMSMDIDRSKRMKQELLDVELLVEDGKIVIFRLNNDKKLSLKYISNSIKTYGYSKRHFENNEISFIDLIYKNDFHIVKSAFQAAIKNNLNDFTFVCRFINASKEIRWISCRAIIIKNHSGEVINFYGYLHDITKIKVSQEELKVKVEEELIKNRNKDKLLIQQSKLASMGEMIGSIAHQWRQPLNNVSLILQFLRDNYLNKNIQVEKIEKYFSRIAIQINYMSDTIDDFRNFYKPSKSMNDFNLKNAIENSIDIIKVQLSNENIILKLKCDDIFLFNYENELKQSLLNIFNNAKDAIFIKRKEINFNAYIKIKVAKKKNDIVINISNNGGEISTDILEKIFQPYFTTKFETQGTGIGLYMTKTIIETNMKGKLHVKNIKDGVKFTITLPTISLKEVK